MEVVDAYWEKRNFGYDVVEITVNKNDLVDVDNIIKMLDLQYRDRYVVLKIPVAHLDFLHQAETLGFNFMEVSITIVKRLGDENGFTPLNEVDNPLMLELVDGDSAFLNVLENIENSMFMTDRICLDPVLSQSVATKRYVNWMKDLYYTNERCELRCYVDKKTNVRVGFVANLHNERKKVVQGVLGGIYKEYQHLGYFPFTLKVLEDYFGRIGIKRIKNAISSNNLQVLRIYSEFGYRVHSSEYVLRRVKQR